MRDHFDPLGLGLNPKNDRAATGATAPGHASTVARVVDALEAKGIRFTATGVELVRKPHR
jgi:hypothetical protein